MRNLEEKLAEIELDLKCRKKSILRIILYRFCGKETLSYLSEKAENAAVKLAHPERAIKTIENIGKSIILLRKKRRYLQHAIQQFQMNGGLN